MTIAEGVVASTLAAFVWGCAGSSAPKGDEVTTCFVTFGGSASASDILAFQSAIEQIAGAAVESTQLSPTTYRWSIRRALSSEIVASINAAMYESPVVCNYCYEGAACLGVMMNKPACR